MKPKAKKRGRGCFKKVDRQPKLQENWKKGRGALKGLLGEKRRQHRREVVILRSRIRVRETDDHRCRVLKKKAGGNYAGGKQKGQISAWATFR